MHCIPAFRRRAALRSVLLQLGCVLTTTALHGQVVATSIDTVAPIAQYDGELLSCLLPRYQYGYVFPTNRFLRGSNSEQEPINGFGSFSLRLGHQATGEKPWQLNYGYPVFGAGVSVTQFSEPDELGTPIAVFGFITAPFKRWPRMSLDYDLALGLAFNWKPFNPVDNPNNVSIGTKQSVFIDVGAQVSFPVAGKLSASAGFSVSHWSNGALRKPNLGINTIAPHVALRYDLRAAPPAFPIVRQRAPFTPTTVLDIAVFAGSQNVVYDTLRIDLVEKYEGVDFLAIGLHACVARQITHKSKVGIGFATDYDGAHDAQVSVENGEIEVVDSPFADKLQLSVFPSYELVLNKLSLVVQPSFYVARKKVSQQTPWYYQRVGIKVHMYRNLFLGVNLRAYQFHVSEYLEWNIGYRITRKAL